jgi:1,2-diacylglycerol 3-beta-galactosyltransferase
VDATAADLRESYQLHPERFTALLIGGGEGAGGLEEIVRAIQPLDLPVQVIVVCGRNEALQRRLTRMHLRTPAHICGFVKTIPELMRAADVVVTKGGPQTIAESLVAGRPVILTQTLPGQEQGNGAFVESRGVGFAPGPVDRIVANLARLAADSDERDWLTQNAVRHGRPKAAVQVAEMIVRLAGAA